MSSDSWRGRFSGDNMKKFVKKIIFISVLALIIIPIFISYISGGIIYSLINNDLTSVVEFVRLFGLFSAIAFVLIIIIEVVFAPIPPLTLYIAGGILFGAFYGGILILIGNMIGSFVDFKIARKYGRKFVEKKVDKKIREKFDKFSKKYGYLSIFLLRINPLTSSDLFSYMAGLTKMKTKHFMFGTALGLIPLIFIQTYFGDIFVRESRFLFTLTILLSFIYLVAMIYLLVKILFSKNKN